MTGARATALLSALCLACGCTELPEISAGTCGNGIVEAGEDCDTRDPSCRPAGKPMECRRDCSIDEATGGRRACDPGWGCGVDDICRLASGQFEARGDTGHEISLAVEIGDFDADGRDDVLVAEPSRSVAYFQDTEGRTSTVTTIPVFAPDASIAQLSADEPAPNEPLSFVAAPDALSAWRGNVDRSFRQVAFAPFDIDPQTYHYATFDAVTAPFGPLAGEEIVGFKVTSPGRAMLIEARLNLDVYEVDYLPSATLALSGNLDLGNPCHELAVAVLTKSHVSIHRLCSGSAGNWSWSPSTNESQVALPAGWVLWAGPLGIREPSPLAALALLNADPLPDLIVRAVPDANPYVDKDAKLYVSFGVGNGTFHSDPQAIPAPPGPGLPPPAGDGQFAALGQTIALGNALQEVPLAIGAISDDQLPDFVTEQAIFVSRPGGSCDGSSAGYACFKPQDDDWVFAAIGEFNQAGAIDVVTLPENGTGLEFFSGFDSALGQGFNRTVVPAVGLVSSVIVGDFDGDFVADFAVREQRGFLEEDSESLSIAWGRVLGPPEPPVSVARFRSIVQLTGGHLASFDANALDGIHDIGILSGTPNDNPDTPEIEPPADLSAAVFYGRGDRMLESPFVLYDAQRDVQSSATRAALGRFDADQHLDIAAISQPDSTGGGLPAPEDSPDQLWLMPAVSGVRINPTRVVHSDVTDERFAPCGARAVAIDLDGDQIDELVVMGSVATEAKGLITIARSAPIAGGNSAWSAIEHHQTDEVVFDAFIAALGCETSPLGNDGDPGQSLGYSSEAFAVDLNRDGLKELVALGYLPLALKQAPIPVLVIYGNLGNGALDVAGRLTYQLPRYAAPLFGESTGPGATGVTAIQADDDPELELVIANLLHPMLAEVSFGDDGAPQALSEPTPFPGFATEESAIAQPDAAGEILYSVSVAAGDIDGDGVEDLASAGPGGVRILYGIPVIR